MAIWQIGLIALVAAWLFQSYGVWRQMRHYQSVFGRLRSSWNDGRLGAGAAPSKLGKGVIALIVISPEGEVRTVSIMQGRSIFAQFKSRDEFAGMDVSALKARIADPRFERGVGLAITKAIEQIEKLGGDDLAARGSASGGVLRQA